MTDNNTKLDIHCPHCLFHEKREAVIQAAKAHTSGDSEKRGSFETLHALAWAVSELLAAEEPHSIQYLEDDVPEYER